MSSASRGLAPREGLECLLVKMGRTGPLVEPHCGQHAGKSGDPRSQNTDNPSGAQPQSIAPQEEARAHEALWGPCCRRRSTSVESSAGAEQCGAG